MVEQVSRGSSRHGMKGSWDLALEPVVEFGTSTQQQVYPSAECGVSCQEQGHQPTLSFCPHATNQLFEITNTHIQEDGGRFSECHSILFVYLKIYLLQLATISSEI